MSIKGFVAGEDETVLSAVPEISCEVSETVQAGTFLITVSGGEAANYDFVYNSGTLTVGNFCETTLSVAEIGEKVYNDLPFALPSVTTNNNRGEITYTIADEGIAVISEGRIYIKGVGKTSLIVRQAATETYSSAEVEVGFTVSKAVLTVTAENKICCQGEVLPELTTLHIKVLLWAKTRRLSMSFPVLFAECPMLLVQELMKLSYRAESRIIMILYIARARLP